MIRPNIVRRVFRRELLDTLRDWNMICIVCVLPFILMPLIFVTMAEVGMQTLSESAEVRPGKDGKYSSDAPRYKVALVGTSAAEFQEKAADQKQLIVVPLPDFPALPHETLRSFFSGEKSSESARLYREEAHRKITDGTVDAVLVCGESVLKNDALKNFWLAVLSDETLPRSKKAGASLRKITDGWREEYRAERLKVRGETEATLRPVAIATEDLAPPVRTLAYAVSALAPALLFMLLLSGCFYSSVQSIAGEKERGTLATVLSAPVQPLELLLGKWMNVMVIGMAGALSTAGSLLLTAVIIISSLSKRPRQTADVKINSHDMISALGFSWEMIPWNQLGLLILALIAVTMVFGAIALVACMFARGTNDASYLLTPILGVVGLPTAIAALPATNWTLGVALIPVLNCAVLVREIFRLTPLEPYLVVLSFFSCVTFSFALLVFGARIFASESIRFTGPTAKGGLFRRPPVGAISSTVSFTAVLILLGGIVYLGIASSGLGTKLLITANQVWMLVVPLGLIWYLRLPMRAALGGQSVRPIIWPGIVLIGLSAWVLTMPLMALFPMPETFIKIMFETFRPIIVGPGGLAAGLFFIAVLPAVCEEIAFRGLIQTGLHRRFSPGVTFVLTSLCFGLAHLSIYRFLPTFILGLILSWVRWQTKSLFPGMVIHGLNNGLAVLVLATISPRENPATLPPWPILVGGLLVLTFGLGWTIKSSRAVKAT